MRVSRRSLLPVVLIGLISLAFLLGQSSTASRSKTQWASWVAQFRNNNGYTRLNNEAFEKPSDLKIVALVFFGRRIFVDILDCYLRANLAINGGFVDEVHFITHTDDKVDIAWLEDLIKIGNMEEYYKVIHDSQQLHGTVWGTFGEIYGRYATDEDLLYVKIDDDMVWLDNDAIPHLVSALLSHPEAHSIQGNVVNSQWNQYFHHATGAILPYLPEPKSTRTVNKSSNASWRDSNLPPYPESDLPPGDAPFLDQDFLPEFENHRWLPLPPTAKNLMRTPWGTGETVPDPATSTKRAAVSWQIAAQEHYSLFHHIEHDNLDIYSYGRNRDGLWNPWFQHVNINMMAFYGRTMKLRKFWGKPGDAGYIRNDEAALTQIVPKELGMPVLVDTRAMVAHYAFHLDGQRENLLMTDILARYRALANDRVCEASNQKGPLDDTVWGSGFENHLSGMRSMLRAVHMEEVEVDDADLGAVQVDNRT